MKKPTLLLLLLASLASPRAADHVVTTTADSGEGSLRAALTAVANAFTGTHHITFDIPTSDPGFDAGTGTWTIAPQTELPRILIGSHIAIDGATQTANRGDLNPYGPEIVIQAPAAGLATGLAFVGDYISVRSLTIAGFEYGILFYGSVASTVADCYIGTTHDGRSAAAQPNNYGIGISGGSYMGIEAGQSHDITVSGCCIGGNTTAGIVIAGAYGNTIAGCRIGCSPDGLAPVPNQQGILLNSASHHNTIGGASPAQRNILSGNANAAIVMDGSGVSGNIVAANFIGLDASGNAPLSNHYGIIVMTNANGNRIGGTTPGERNIISANSEIGIYIESADSNHVCGNYIGLDSTGSHTFTDSRDTALQANGVEVNSTGAHNIIGGGTPQERNVISGNKVYGCIYYGNCHHNNICGNYIGTDATGSLAVPNATGICVDGSSNHNIMEHNLLSGNRSYGLFIVTRGTDSNLFRGNLVGCAANGADPLPNDVGLMLAADAKGNVVGGEDPSDRNIFSGNRYAGIEVTDYGTSGNRIVGNYIGVGATGATPLPNENGVVVSALVDSLEIAGNVIAANTQFGVVITDRASHVRLSGNHIGTDARRTAVLGNGASGVFLGGGAHHNVIGPANAIAFNDSAAVVLTDDSTLCNRITQNAIFGNRHAGIDIFPWGPNDNDPDDSDRGCNGLMNHPEITTVDFHPGTGEYVVGGTLATGDPQRCTVELFVADAAAAVATPREGRTYLGSATPDDDGSWQVILTSLAPSLPLAATATDADGNTSEFSPSATLPVGLRTANAGAALACYPNPCRGTLHIVGIDPSATLWLYDAAGRLILFRSEAGAGHYDLTGIPSGHYTLFLRLQDGALHSSHITKL